MSKKYKDVNSIVNESNLNNSGFYVPFYYSYLIPFNVSKNINNQNPVNCVNLNQSNLITFLYD